MADSAKKHLFQALRQFLEDFLLRKAAQTPILTAKHSESFALEKGVTPGWISLLYVSL